MKYYYNKINLLRALENLRAFIDSNWVEDGRRNSPIRRLSEELECALDTVEEEFDDVFGTEGFERTIYGRD